MFLGIDIGGTKIKFVTTDAGGGRLGEGSMPTPRLGSQAVLDKLIQLVETLSGGFERIEAIAIAVPGHVDRDLGQTMFLPNVPGEWNGFPLVEGIERATGIPTIISNDARAFATGELELGSAAGQHSAVFVTIGTGVGGAIALDGVVLRNREDSVGEIGHIQVEPSGPICGCGSRGCAEAIAGGAAIVRHARVRGITVPGSSTELIRSPAEVRAAATAGSTAAQSVITNAADAVGAATSSACALLGINVVIVGGGLGLEWPEFGDAISRHLASREGLIGTASISRATLGDRAGALGAALIARNGITSHMTEGLT